MTSQIDSEQKIHARSLNQRILQGAALAFILITIFIVFLCLASDYPFGLGALLPIISVSIAGGFGGALYYFLDSYRYQGGWKKIIVNSINLFVYIAILYFTLIVTLAALGLWD